MKLKYIGESFGVDSLTNGKIYDATVEDNDYYRVIDDSGEDYLYPKNNPAPLDGSSVGGRWEIIEKWIKALNLLFSAFVLAKYYLCSFLLLIVFIVSLTNFITIKNASIIGVINFIKIIRNNKTQGVMINIQSTTVIIITYV